MSNLANNQATIFKLDIHMLCKLLFYKIENQDYCSSSSVHLSNAFLSLMSLFHGFSKHLQARISSHVIYKDNTLLFCEIENQAHCMYFSFY